MLAEFTPTNLLAAYACGIFPMADDDGEISWFAPDPRGIIELSDFHISRSLRSVIRREVFEVSFDRAFEDVIDACAARTEGTWISNDIREAYVELHRVGFAHSVECWRDGALAGGLYGVCLGGVFFGESMFHCVTDASKVALHALIDRMKHRGLVLLDIQFITPHLQQFGAVEISRSDYMKRLEEAIEVPAVLTDTEHGNLGNQVRPRDDGSNDQ